MRYVLFCLPLFLLMSCSKHYTSEKIGWTITLPGKAWKVILPKEGENTNANTKTEVGEFIGVKIDGSRVQELISLRKDSTSNFVSVIETYNSTSNGQYEKLLLNQHESLKAMYLQKTFRPNTRLAQVV